jgi:hypothetical protein
MATISRKFGMGLRKFSHAKDLLDPHVKLAALTCFDIQIVLMSTQLLGKFEDICGQYLECFHKVCGSNNYLNFIPSFQPKSCCILVGNNTITSFQCAMSKDSSSYFCSQT